MDSGELEYIQNGNRRLIADAAIWDWYHRAKKTAKPPARQGGYVILKAATFETGHGFALGHNPGAPLSLIHI